MGEAAAGTGVATRGQAAPADHRDVLAGIGAERMARLSERRNGPGLVRLGTHLGLIALLGAGVLATEGAGRLALQAAMGVPLVFLFAALHETTHRTAFASRRLNEAVARAAGFLLLLPAEGFRWFHLAHHRHTQDPDRDPELVGPKPSTRAGYVLKLTGLPVWASQIRGLLDAARGRLPAHVPPKARARVRREARGHLAGYALIAALSAATGSTLALTLWIVPLVLGQPWLRWVLMAEHTACPAVPDMLSNTRTTRTHRALRWLMWEMPWHTAHHAAPTVPFHRLALLSGLMEPHLRQRAEGYPAAHAEIRAALATPR